MKIIKNILIIIGAVLLLNYIVYLPMCVDDYIREESEVYSVQMRTDLLPYIRIAPMK